jgi:hypothetical protein
MFQNVPGKLLLFYRVQGFDQVWVLVHCCGYETFTEGMFASSKIISRHELSFQRSSTHWSVPTLECIMVDSISHGVVGIEEAKEKDGKLDYILASSIPMHKVMVVTDRKTEWASKFMHWGENLYNNGVTICAKHISILKKTIDTLAKNNRCTWPALTQTILPLRASIRQMIWYNR